MSGDKKHERNSLMSRFTVQTLEPYEALRPVGVS